MPLAFDVDNPRAVMVHAYVKQFTEPSKLDENFFVVVGGDGFMLKTVRENYSPEAVFLGLNCGHLGFLLNDIPDNLQLLPRLISAKNLHVMTFPRLAMEAIDSSGKSHPATALNDIYLERMSGQTAHLRIEIDHTVVIRELASDGLIVSTALGSTAYNYSAGGCVCHPSLDIVSVTPISPHAPRFPSLIMPLDSMVSVQVIDPEHRKVRAVADGVEHNDVKGIRVRNAKSPVKLAFFPDHGFTPALVRKILNV